MTNAFVPLKRILNIEVIISPVFQQQGAHYVDWPSALLGNIHLLFILISCLITQFTLANFNEKFADLGNLEAYGTLWKLVERADFPGVNKKFIHFETAEIGENNIFYLTKTLELSDKRADAAIWEINVVENTNNHILESTLLGTFKPKDNTLKTLAIQCKLVYMDNANEIDNAHDSIYLASMITDNGIKGITVLNLKETNPNYRYAISWDIISETTGSTLSSDGLPVEDEFA